MQFVEQGSRQPPRALDLVGRRAHRRAHGLGAGDYIRVTRELGGSRDLRNQIWPLQSCIAKSCLAKSGLLDRGGPQCGSGVEFVVDLLDRLATSLDAEEVIHCA